MSEFYTHFTLLRNKVFIRGYDADGKQFLREKEFRPSLFTPAPDATDPTWKTMDGSPLKRIEFDSPRDLKDFARKYEDVANFKIYGFPNSEYVAINQWYPGKIAYNPELVRTFYIDIECDSGDGTFPEPAEAKWPINSISIVTKDVCVCFGLGEFDTTKLTEEYHLPIKFKSFHTEDALLKAFVRFNSHFSPDIISGWNIESFDIPYLVNRIINVLGEDFAKQLSPYGRIRARTYTGRFGREEVTYDLEGVSILDYLQLYQKHTFVTRESYKLDHIAHVELGERKIEYEGNLFTLYRDNPQLFFEYNCKDSILVKRLDEKLGLMNLVLNLAYFAKINYNDTFSPVKLWDVIVANRLADEKVVVPYDSPHTQAASYEGAYVHEPKPGRYKWVISVDLDSMYPMNIRSWNIGPDTYIPPHQLSADLRKLKEHVIMSGVQGLIDMKVDTSALKQHNVCMAANGEFYRRDSEGILSRLVGELYVGRKADKKGMLMAKSRAEEIKAELHRRGVA